MGNSPSGFVKIDNVAFVNPLSSKKLNKSITQLTQLESSMRGGGGKVRSKLGLTGASAKANLDGSADLKKSVVHKNSVKEEQSFVTTNVIATYAGAAVCWEVNPRTSESNAGTLTYLEGDVFTSSNGKKRIACSIVRCDKGPISGLVINASVFIETRELEILQVTFSDDDGIEVSLSDLCPIDSIKEAVSSVIFRKTAKERLIRQIVRKHLIDQGMQTHGSQIEICRASV